MWIVALKRKETLDHEATRTLSWAPDRGVHRDNDVLFAGGGSGVEPVFGHR
jgi:hypothetical protein